MARGSLTDLLADAFTTVLFGKKETARAKEKYQPLVNEASQARKDALAALQAEYDRQLAEMEAARDAARAAAEAAHQAQSADIDSRKQLAVVAA